MSFDYRDIRKAMDVYTLDNEYLGSVRAIIPGAERPSASPAIAEALQASEVNGEMLGPMPTRMIGNRGPDTQGAANVYAATSDGAEPIGSGALVIGRWHGLIGRRLIPMDAVQTIGLERVVLRLTSEELAALSR